MSCCALLPYVCTHPYYVCTGTTKINQPHQSSGEKTNENNTFQPTLYTKRAGSAVGSVKSPGPSVHDRLFQQGVAMKKEHKDQVSVYPVYSMPLIPVLYYFVIVCLTFAVVCSFGGCSIDGLLCIRYIVMIVYVITYVCWCRRKLRWPMSWPSVPLALSCPVLQGMGL